MTTPADWYQDPEDPASLRYWDGASWTEHRAPAQAPAAPAAEQATSVVSLPDEATNVYATRPVEQEPAPEEPQHGAHSIPDDAPSDAPSDAQEIPAQPYDTHPPASDGPPPQAPVSWDAPMPSWDTPSTEQTYTPPPTQSFEPAPFAPPPGPPGPPAPPTGPSGEGPNKKLVFGILGGAAAILLALAAILAYVLIRQDDDPTVTSSPTTSSSTSKTTSTESTTDSSSDTTSPGSPTPPPPGAEGSDGDYTFSVASTETGDTITSTVSDDVETTADGMYYVIRLNVANTGAEPLTFVATFQGLNAAGQTFPLDDEATAFLGGTIATIAPGEQVETPLVYDVPVGTEPDSILLRADPSTPGVELPLR